jgi:uncharacterized Zn-finger protein
MVESIRGIAIITPLPIPEKIDMPDGAPSTPAAATRAASRNTSSPSSGNQMTPTEIIHVDERTVACDGGDGALGHPRVFLRIAGEQVMCPYCSRLYVLNPGADHASGH